MRAWCQLLRLALAPTILWDVAAGALLAGLPLGVELLPPAAVLLLLYHGGMVLNAWADRAADAYDRPERPLPAGRVPAGAALAAGLLLPAAGLGLAWTALPRSAAEAATALAGIVLLYDLGGRNLRGLIGPTLLAVARALSLAFAGLAGGVSLFGDRGGLAAAAAYAVYVLFLSRLATREERGAPGMRALAYLLAAAVTPFLAAPREAGAGAWAAFLAGALALAAWLVLPAWPDRHRSWTPERVQRGVRQGLAALPALPGLALLADGRPVGVAAVAVIAAVAWLGRRLPPS
ncbi:MAG: hypothetical protein D6702_05080 [Planctomycetota bacterium]|nr:MAG: hypothetical protein D6702_05080 [Planctomycetota bacterium]